MVIQCKSCGRRYELAGAENKLVRCGGCGASFDAFECLLPESTQHQLVAAQQGRMSQGMKMFIGVSSAFVLLLALVIPLSVGTKWYNGQRQKAALAGAQNGFEKAMAASSEGEFIAAEEAIGSAIRSAEAMPKPDAALLEKLRIHQVAISTKASQQRAAEEQRRLAEARHGEAEEGRRRQQGEEQKKQAAATEQARTMYPAYKESANALADELLRFISATEAGLTYYQHSEKLQNLQFVYNKFNMRCSESEKRYTSYQQLSAAVEQLREAGQAWRVKIESAKSSSSDEELQKAWSAATVHYREAMAALARSD